LFAPESSIDLTLRVRYIADVQSVTGKLTVIVSDEPGKRSRMETTKEIEFAKKSSRPADILIESYNSGVVSCQIKSPSFWESVSKDILDTHYSNPNIKDLPEGSYVLRVTLILKDGVKFILQPKRFTIKEKVKGRRARYAQAVRRP